MVVKQRRERSQGRALINRNETLARPEMEIMHEHTRNAGLFVIAETEAVEPADKAGGKLPHFPS